MYTNDVIKLLNKEQFYGYTFEQIAQHVQLNNSMHACAAQTVVAKLVTTTGNVYYGSNMCVVKHDTCPRRTANMPSGTGYDLCASMCNQPYHGETSAINECVNANDTTVGGTMYVYGHTVCCSNCQSSMKEAGITKAIVVDSGKEYLF